MSWRVTMRCNRAEGEAVGDMEEPFGDHPNPPVIVADDPLTCVVRGCGKALENMEKLSTIFTSD